MTEINVTNETIEEIQKKKSSRRKLWIINGIILFITPILSLFSMLTFSIAGYFFMPIIVTNLIVWILYILRQKWQKLSLPLNIARITAILTIILSMVPSAICINFETAELMYPLKKIIFAYGVRSQSATVMSRLPDTLPENIKDYHFKTQRWVPAQDYYPIAILSFRTDKTTIEQFEAECKENGGQLVEYNASFEEYLIAEELTEYKDDVEFIEYVKHEYSRRRGLPINAFFEFTKDKQEDIIGNSAIYTFNDSEYFSHGYAFDYDSGLVVVWG